MSPLLDLLPLPLSRSVLSLVLSIHQHQQKKHPRWLTSCSTSSRISSLNSSVDSCLSAATSVSPSTPVTCVLSSSFTNNSPCSRSSAIRRSTSTSTAFEIWINVLVIHHES
ncbi:hypothetical protein EV361DRAFT_876265, partial [Lentinula raphanica]